MFEGLTVSKAISKAKELYLPRPKSVPRTFTKTGLTSSEYKKEYEAWEKARAEYEKDMTAYEKRYSEVNDALEDLMKKEAGLDKVPEASRQKVWSLAWQLGYSSGYSEIYDYLTDLVDLF